MEGERKEEGQLESKNEENKEYKPYTKIQIVNK